MAAASVPYIFLLHVGELWWALFLQHLFTVSSDGQRLVLLAWRESLWRERKNLSAIADQGTISVVIRHSSAQNQRLVYRSIAGASQNGSIMLVSHLLKFAQVDSHYFIPHSKWTPHTFDEPMVLKLLKVGVS